MITAASSRANSLQPSAKPFFVRCFSDQQAEGYLLAKPSWKS